MNCSFGLNLLNLAVYVIRGVFVKRYKLSIPIGIVLLISTIFAGCVSHQEQSEQINDSDGDGYNDNVDDFPTDPNLHLKEEYKGSYQICGGIGKPPLFYQTIESDWKYVDLKWSITPDNASIREALILIVDMPNSYKIYEGNEVTEFMNKRFVVTYENCGDWEIALDYRGGTTSFPRLIDCIEVSYDICKVK